MIYNIDNTLKYLDYSKLEDRDKSIVSSGNNI